MKKKKMTNQSKKHLEDGVDHINIYSQGKTPIGKFLSNFALSPIQTEDGQFNSIEGYWYWLGCKHPQKDKLKKAWGYYAKMLGREFGSPNWIDDDIFKDKIRKAIKIKLESNPTFLNELNQLKLPLTHYYIYQGKRIYARKAEWVIEYIESFKSSQL